MSFVELWILRFIVNDAFTNRVSTVPLSSLKQSHMKKYKVYITNWRKERKRSEALLWNLGKFYFVKWMKTPKFGVENGVLTIGN